MNIGYCAKMLVISIYEIKMPFSNCRFWIFPLFLGICVNKSLLKIMMRFMELEYASFFVENRHEFQREITFKTLL